jgi:hypothetical protein
MFRRWVRLAGLAGLVFACGERHGDPIVARQGPADTSAAGIPGAAGEEPTGAGGSATSGPAGAGGAADVGGAEPGPGGAPAASIGPTGLCGPCETSESCGDANDACIRHDGASFCGRDCDEGFGCPNGYTCVQLDNSRLLQCVPTTSCGTPAAEPPSLTQIRDYLLSRINAERVQRGHGPLAPSTCLDELAQQSAIDYAGTDEPLGKFVEECDPVWPACECDWGAEAEVAVADYALDWSTAIEIALGTNRFTSSFDLVASDVGIGFWISGDEAWIALSFR